MRFDFQFKLTEKQVHTWKLYPYLTKTMNHEKKGRHLVKWYSRVHL